MPRRRPRVSSTSRGVVDDVVVRQLGMVDEQHDEVGGCELVGRAGARAVIGGPSVASVGHERVVRAHVGAELAQLLGDGHRRRARASRTCPALYARPSSRIREPFTDRAVVVQHRDDARDHVVGHAAVDVVGELDEPEPLAEAPLDAPREVRRVDRQAVPADARARA